MTTGNSNKDFIRRFYILFAIFIAVILIIGIIAYNYAAILLKRQLALKCQALAATISAVYAENSDGYAAFLNKMDMESEYYLRAKSLMMNLKQLNEKHVTYIYTTARVDEDTIMYVIGGENPSRPVYTAPGVTDAIAGTERRAYDGQMPVLGEDFEDTKYGRRLSAYHPIFHKETGEFLGMAAADIVSTQFNDIMVVFIILITAILITGIAVMAFATRRLSSNAYLVVSKQILAAREAKQRLEAENAALDRINQMKTELMTNISHEARTPLAVLASHAGLVSVLLKKRGFDEQTTADLDKIVYEAQRVANLIDSMKTLTLTGQGFSKREKVDICDLIRQTAGLYRPIFGRGRVKLRVNANGALYVYGSTEELTQVIFNVIQNAKDHTRAGSVSIKAGSEKGFVTVTVTDTGTGVPPDILPKVFERGVKISEQGLGIGLSISKEIVESHGGTITVNNAEPKGAKVTVTLPEYKE
jgi:signal transduction histidine kinase